MLNVQIYFGSSINNSKMFDKGRNPSMFEGILIVNKTIIMKHISKTPDNHHDKINIKLTVNVVL